MFTIADSLNKRVLSNTLAINKIEEEGLVELATNTDPGIASFPTGGGLNVTEGAVSIDTGSDIEISHTNSLNLAPTGVTPGTYSASNLAIDVKGRILSAQSGFHMAKVMDTVLNPFEVVYVTPGVSITRPSTGTYIVTIPEQSQAVYPIFFGLALSSNATTLTADDIQISYLESPAPTTTTFTVCTREQDNGTNPGRLRNNGFSVMVPRV